MTNLVGVINTEKSPPVIRWLWRGLIALAAIALLVLYGNVFDSYEITIVVFTGVCLALLGQNWPGFRIHIIVVSLLSLFAVQQYGSDLAIASSNFFLNYILASQSAFMWMSVLFILATVAYFAGLLFRSEFTEKVGTALTWSATTMGMVGLMVRWRESYLISPDVGHIPVSNLYEVFILFAVITALLYFQ